MLEQLNIFMVNKEFQTDEAKAEVAYGKTPHKPVKTSKCRSWHPSTKLKASMGIVYAGVGFIWLIILLTLSIYQSFVQISPCILINNILPSNNLEYRKLIQLFGPETAYDCVVREAASDSYSWK